MASRRKSNNDGSDSDMAISSGEEGNPGSTTTPNTSIIAAIKDQPKGDDMQLGVDFIGFEDSDGEDGNLDNGNVGQKSSSATNEGTADTQLNTHGTKRKRSQDDEETDPELAPITGPPPGCPWMGHRNYAAMASVPRMLTQELKDFVEFISPTREEHQIRKYVLRRIRDIIQELWSDADVMVFGSFDTRLYLPTSDLDVVVIRDKAFFKEDLHRLSNHLRVTQSAVEISVIASAKVPIVKFKEAISGIAVDISFNIINGVQSGAVINSFIDEMPALRPLTMLIKHFLMTKSLNEVYHGGVGSYTTVIMILSFLQMHPQVQMRRINPQDNLGVLLIEFFELYGLCFNYNSVGISVRDGGSYYKKDPNTPAPFFRGGPGPRLVLSCDDPNDPKNNTAAGSYAVWKVREAFVRAYGTLTGATQKRQQELFTDHRGHSRNDRATHVRFDEHNRVAVDSKQKSSGLHHSTQVSLIKDVFIIPSTIIRHRQKIADVFYDGTYQRMYNEPEGIHGLDDMESAEREISRGDGSDKYSSNDSSEEDGAIRKGKTKKKKNKAMKERQNTKLEQQSVKSGKPIANRIAPLRDVEFVDGGYSDEDEEDDYFVNLMKQAGKEYEVSDEEACLRSQRKESGHRDPANVIAKEDSIQLPQLQSVANAPRNSSRNEQLSKDNKNGNSNRSK
ncbi:hypothetical protein BGZ54_004050 [Gamsiella multidivaricata]|nr:hypothetical protein BGZ54_004050 [Gamsiella multidivaricata]